MIATCPAIQALATELVRAILGGQHLKVVMVAMLEVVTHDICLIYSSRCAKCNTPRKRRVVLTFVMSFNNTAELFQIR